MLIGELAQQLGVTTKTLRHYEKIGLLQPPARDGNGYRSYAGRTARRARLVVDLRNLGLALQDVSDLLKDEVGRSLRRRLLGRLDGQIADRDLKIAVLQGERDELQARFDALIDTPKDRIGTCICAATLSPCDCAAGFDPVT